MPTPNDTDPTLASLAGEAFDAFETRTRQGGDDGDTFVTTREDAPEWVRDIVQDAHGDMLPDDWRYECIQAAFGHIHDTDGDDDAGEFADSHVDIYTAARLAWLSSRLDRSAYCDEAVDAGLVAPNADITDRIGIGQYMEASEVFGVVLAGLEARLEEVES